MCGNKLQTKQNSNPSTFHFVVVGSGGVGKSAITIRFVNRLFEAKYDPTIEDRYQKIVDYQGIPCVLEILDTAGQDTFSAMRELYMKKGEGFVLVYSISSRTSFEDLYSIRENILRHKNNKPVPMIIVGNKCDLIKKRKIDTREGKDLSKEFGCPFIETSAKTNLNIPEIFNSLIDQIWSDNGVLNSESTSRKKACSIL